MQKKFNNVEQAILDGAEVGIEYALDGAERLAKKRIETSGTYGSSRRFSGAYEPFAGPGRSGTGRIDTGLMYDSIERSVDLSNDKVVGHVGWPSGSPKYFYLQEDGFNYVHNNYPISGQDHHVEGMFAWRDAQTLLSKTGPGLVASWVKEYVRRATS